MPSFLRRPPHPFRSPERETYMTRSSSPAESAPRSTYHSEIFQGVKWNSPHPFTSGHFSTEAAPADTRRGLDTCCPHTAPDVPVRDWG